MTGKWGAVLVFVFAGCLTKEKIKKCNSKRKKIIKKCGKALYQEVAW
jgi:hypothetical protein